MLSLDKCTTYPSLFGPFYGKLTSDGAESYPALKTEPCGAARVPFHTVCTAAIYRKKKRSVDKGQSDIVHIRNPGHKQEKGVRALPETASSQQKLSYIVLLTQCSERVLGKGSSQNVRLR